METHKSCSVFGTNNMVITDTIKERLRQVFIDLLEKNYRTFYFGGFSMFDDTCYKIICELKEQYPDIHRIFCVADPMWLRASKRPKWLNDETYEEIVYLDLDFDWWYQRIYFRNCEIINRSDFVVFYAPENNRSGAYKALKYAKSKKKDYIDLSAE